MNRAIILTNHGCFHHAADLHLLPDPICARFINDGKAQRTPAVQRTIDLQIAERLGSLSVAAILIDLLI